MSSLPKNFPNQDWFNRQSYEVLAEITEMLWKTHTINIPEWDKMTEEDVNERCKEWGVERGKNIWHSRWRLRAANDDQSDDEESDQETDQEESEEELEELETDSEEEEETFLASKRKRDAETGKRLLNQALSRDQDSSDGFCSNPSWARPINAFNVSGFADKFALNSYATHYNIIACHSSGRIQLDLEYKYNMDTLSLSVCVCVCVRVFLIHLHCLRTH